MAQWGVTKECKNSLNPWFGRQSLRPVPSITGRMMQIGVRTPSPPKLNQSQGQMLNAEGGMM